MALSAIVGVFITIGITVAAGGTLYYTFTSQTDPFTTSSAVEVRNLNAVNSNDELRITATLKNSGQTSITKVIIDSITVSGITIGQEDDNTFKFGTTTINASKITRDDGIGDDSTLEGGRTQALALTIKSDANPDLRDVNISDKLNLVLKFTSGQDELLTDVFTTRVKPG